MHPDFKRYCILMAGQAISMLGSTLTTFALSVWVFQQNESVVEFSMIVLASVLPMALLSPVAGNLADRFNRKTIMMIGQTVAVLITLCLALLYWTNTLSVIHIIILTVIGTSFNAVVLPCIQSSITMMVAAEDLNRANAILQLASGFIRLIAPALAGYLMVQVGISFILIIDLVTFVFGATALIITPIPQPAKNDKDHNIANERVIEKMIFSFNYLKSKPGLLPITLLSASLYLSAAAIFILVPPLLLSLSNEMGLGTVMSVSGVGIILGSLLLMSKQGANLNYASWVMASMTYIAIGFVFFAMNSSIFYMSVLAALITFGAPIWLSCDQTLMQTKCAPDVQGRIFGFRNFIFSLSPGFAILLVGPLADNYFEPLMQPGQILAEQLGWLFGTGKGRGIAVMMTLFGLFSLSALLIGWCIPSVRHIDKALPNYERDSDQTQPLAV